MSYNPKDLHADYCKATEDRGHRFHDIPRRDRFDPLVLYCERCGLTLTVHTEEMVSLVADEVTP